MNIAVILAGGTGSRADAHIPKQCVEVDGRPMIAFCMETFFAHEEIDAVQIVADETGSAYAVYWTGSGSVPDRLRRLFGWEDIMRRTRRSFRIRSCRWSAPQSLL